MKGKVKFVETPKTDFFKVLRGRVNQYFEDNGIKKTGDYRMVLKSIAMLSLYLVPFAVICLGVLPAWATLFCWMLMGLGVAGVGMSVMHDANHGAYSDKPLVNSIMGRTIYLLGGSKFTWKIQHNILHHTYTNIYGLDEDIHDKPILRLSPHGQLGFLHRYQHVYGFVLYGLATLGWAINKDFKQLIRYNRNGMTQSSGGDPTIEMLKLIASKLFYYLMLIGIPLIATDYAWGWILLGYLIMHFTSGLVLTTIFQLAHLVEDMEHPQPSEGGVIENGWAIHQLQTTSNFAKKNKVLSWYVGGLNYQVEHHLFHNICHIHYSKIAPIVKQTAEEYGISYHEMDTFWQALGSHWRVLRGIGKNNLAV